MLGLGFGGCKDTVARILIGKWEKEVCYVSGNAVSDFELGP